MAGLTAAWRLSEPGWQDRFESITVYQRGWRLGGKGASSRGQNGRIEEHGLHVWLGSYENAFTLLRECYAELDRATTDPESPIHTWDQALVPANDLGAADDFNDEWQVWLGRFSRTADQPGDPDPDKGPLTVVGFFERMMQLIGDLVESMKTEPDTGLTLSVSPTPPKPPGALPQTVQRAVLAATIAILNPRPQHEAGTDLLGQVLDAVRETLDYDRRTDHRRTWILISLLTATARGMIVDNLMTDPRGLRTIQDEDFSQWALRHGAHPDTVDFPLVRAMYDMVFGWDKADPDKPAFGAGLGVLFTGVMLFRYKGAIFWKMTAGMGDVVIAPLYQALRRRGVDFEFFHRLDALHLDAHHHAIESVTLGRQVRLAAGVEHYEPLTTVGGLPVFPDRPLADQIEARDGLEGLESHFGSRDDVETRVLRRGADFDQIILAVSLGMLPIVAGELIDDRPEWREMTTKLHTVATQAFQLWLRPDHETLGLRWPGATISGYVTPYDTWASMPQTLWAEQWPDDDRPGTVAYFCGPLQTDWPTSRDPAEFAAECERRAQSEILDYLQDHVRLFFPNAVTDDGFAWHMLTGVNGHRGSAALATQHVSVNIDPSDRYVQSVPGTDRYRLRPDESGYDNLVLAGDWTDSGMNAGCIESSVLSGLQAANAILGRGRHHRIRGFYIP
ncbi:amine oxidase [Mycobacterium sp. ACS4331]|nr:amine oxidase [Mycobacterium sp. ACS4331]